MKANQDLQRFLKAQDPAYASAVQELKTGRKQGHWMWFIFPQAAGLGRSAISRQFAIQNKAEALAYLHHPILGDRLRTCARILLGLEGKTAQAIFSSPDDLKLKSSMTLFAEISEPGNVFEQVLDKYYEGKRCPYTMTFIRMA